MRREFLKGYIMSLIAEGEFTGMRSPAQMAKKAMTMFAQDVPAVLGEMANTFAEQGFRKVSSVVLGKMDQVAADLGKRGFSAVWSDLQEQYKRGVEANHGAASHGARKR